MKSTGESSPDEDDGPKRKQPPLPTGTKPSKKVKRVGPREDAQPTGADSDNKDENGVGKPKRTRTGCLTCRERHLKCDEGLPACNNCLKSNRVCKRGVRLNFIDIICKQPPRSITRFGTAEWEVEFQDESREIASEYEGGEERYKSLDEQEYRNGVDPMLKFEYQPAALPAPPFIHSRTISQTQDLSLHKQQQQPDTSQMYDPRLTQQTQAVVPILPTHSSSGTHSNSERSTVTPRPADGFSLARVEMLLAEEDKRRDFLDSAEETLFMQVFVEEVGLWMDSMDPSKHFSRILPFHAMSEPMLLNAFLACGARHLALVNSIYTEEKALHYYDTATSYILKSLQNPERDTVVCATAAVILNVYEIMSERAMQRMYHIAGARALIKECGWDARSQGIGAACFWLNVGLEVLSCLHFNWQVAWDPDTWGVDMDFSREMQSGREEIWTHRMLYLIAKVCNYRATLPHYENELNSCRDPGLRTQQRYEEWVRLRSMLDSWDRGVPRTMQPLAYIPAYQTAGQSAFPEVWLVKRSTIVARLLFHTAMLLLAQTNPYFPPSHFEMAELQAQHATTICGIVVHVKDRGVASVAIRSLAHAAEVLKTRREQEEVVRTFEKINRETGWRIGFVYFELMEKWGWAEEPSARQFLQTHTGANQQKKMQSLSRSHSQAQIPSAVQAMQMPRQQSLGFTSPQQLHQSSPLSQSHSISSGITVAPPPSVLGSMSNSSTPPQHQQQPSQQPNQQQQRAAAKKLPQGIPNPLYAKADFSLPQHPYQNFYVAPSTPMRNTSHVLNGPSLVQTQQLYYGS